MPANLTCACMRHFSFCVLRNMFFSLFTAQRSFISKSLLLIVVAVVTVSFLVNDQKHWLITTFDEKKKFDAIALIQVKDQRLHFF